MNIGLSLHMIGITLVFLSIFMLFPIVISLIYKGRDLISLIISFSLTFLTGALLYVFTQKYKRSELRSRDAFYIVTLSWVLVALFGSIPFLLTGTFQSFTDAYFESMAGFTTTGASVLKNVEELSIGILFWRSLTQWIGGMGIIVFALAILPLIGSGGMQLFKAEVPEISVDKIKPRIIDTAKALWLIYVVFTIILIALYLTGGMNIIDALCHAFTTMATGGFSTKNSSVAHFQSPFIEYVTSLFMFLAGINYTLYFYAFRGNVKKIFKSDEFKFYLSITIIASLFICINLYMSHYHNISDSFRFALFQVISIMTTTGYATADFEKWPFFSQTILIMLMFFGGMIGSTGGGIKQVRMLLMLKHGYREMYQLIHPRAITTVKLDERILSKDILGSIWGFVFLFLFVYSIAIIAMSATGLDIITSATTVISAMSNVGPALGEAGPTENYSTIPTVGKWILTFCMLAGRLEIYTVLILFIPQFWKK
jgi:trk system potassium uptake protein TrkH